MADKIKKQFDLTSFQRANDAMIARNENAYNDFRWNITATKTYTIEEIERIGHSGNLEQQQKLSRNYFLKDGLYKRIIIHYATLLKYVGILIPSPSYGKKLSTSHIQKRYFAAMDYLDEHITPELQTNWTMRALIDGSYYGVIQELNKNNFVVLDLPAAFSRSRFKDMYGNDIIEFDVKYFNTITDETDRAQALSVYPKVVSSYYRKYSKGKTTNSWVKIPPELCICFSLTNDNCPFFLDVIAATARYDEAVETERERELDEIRKIIVQKVPHLNDGSLLFEPEEAAEMHAGSVKMMKGNKNISILTTYTDVDSIISRTSAEAKNNNLEKMKQNVYSEAGVSSEIFSPTGGQALGTSITNDLSMMMIFANKYSRFISYILNVLFANSNIKFKYNILPVTYHNQSDFVTDAFKLAQSGYSYLMPSVAMGVSQKELLNLKELENDVLKLDELLIPLSSAYTQSAAAQVKDGETKEAGAPEKKVEEKSEKTIKNEESIDNQGGSK